MKQYIIVLLTCLCLGGNCVMAQNVVVDEILAVVGNKIIKKSDLESEYTNYRLRNGGIAGSETNIKTQLLELMLIEKLYLNQAQIDSVKVTSEEVEQEMENRMKYLIAQFGTRQKMEEYYKRSTFEMKDELRDAMENEMLSRQVKQKIAGNVTVTPNETQQFFESLPADSIPLVAATYELGTIVKKPVVSIEEEEAIKEKMTALRDRVLNGESFSVLARLYSEDKGSASKGGDLGEVQRGNFVPEFEIAAFALKPGEISPIVKTKYGYHIIQMISRKGEYINVRHILLQVKPSIEALAEAKAVLDTVYTRLKNNELAFAEAAKQYSDDKTKGTGGMMINPYTNGTAFEAEHLDQSTFHIIDRLKEGEFSQPIPFEDENSLAAYRILYLKKRTQPHKANMTDDYDKIKQAAIDKKTSDLMEQWIKQKISNTFIQLSDQCKQYKFVYNWSKD